jgi:hypothetical protein
MERAAVDLEEADLDGDYDLQCQKGDASGGCDI